MTDVNATQKLKTLRLQIDKIDKNIISQLAARMRISKKIGEVKRQNNIPIVQKARWNELMKNRIKLSVKLNLTVKFIDTIFRMIQKESIALQKKAK